MVADLWDVEATERESSPSRSSRPRSPVRARRAVMSR